MLAYVQIISVIHAPLRDNKDHINVEKYIQLRNNMYIEIYIKFSSHV
jgi:hypothetical protein